MFQRALAGFEQTLGRDHTKTRTVSSNLDALLRLNVKDEPLELQAFESSPVQAVKKKSKNTVNKSRKRDTFYKVFRGEWGSINKHYD